MKDINEIKREVNLIDYARRRGIDVTDAGKAHCPFDPPDNNRSFSIIKGDDGFWHWTDFHDGSKGTIVDLVMRMDRVDDSEACRKLLAEYGDPKPMGHRAMLESTEPATAGIPELVHVILGALILKPSLMNDSGLTKDDFPFGRARDTFAAIRGIWEDTQPQEIDIVQVSEEIGGDNPITFITALTDGAIKLEPMIFKGRVAELRKRAITRRLVTKIECQARTGVLRLGPLLQDIKDYETLSMEAAADEIAGFSLASKAGDFRAYIEARRGKKFWGHEIKSLPMLTRVLMGIRDMTVLCAKAKTGKSTLALQISSDLNKDGVGVLYYDFENGPFSIMSRKICRDSSLTFEDLFSADPTNRGSVEMAIRGLEELRDFAIITDRKLTIEKVRSHVELMKAATSRPEVLVVIDSLQKLPMENLKERRAAIDLWLRGLEELKAEDPAVTILMISELSRDGGKPKESGDIEYTGHFLLELEMDMTDDEIKRGGDNGIRRLRIKSARDIPIPSAALLYHADFRHWTFNEGGDA